MSLIARLILGLTLCGCMIIILAIPSFEGVTSWSSIGLLVPGMSILEARGPPTPEGVYTPNYLSIQAPRGMPGNATIYRNNSPPLFYIHQNHLWQYHNESTILPMNVLNTTSLPGYPLQMAVGKTQEGVRGGFWRWQGTLLYYERGSQSNDGLFYSCQNTNGLTGVYVYLESAPPPPGCTIFTIHSFSSSRQY